MSIKRKSQVKNAAFGSQITQYRHILRFFLILGIVGYGLAMILLN